MLFSVEELALSTWDSPLVAALTTPTRRASAEERRTRSDWSRSRSQSSGDASSQQAAPEETAASSASSTPERNNRTYAKPGKHGSAPIPSLEDEGSARASIAPRLSTPRQSASAATWGTTIMSFTSNYVSPASSREDGFSRTESQSDELSDSEQYLNLQELAKELRYGEQYLDSETLRLGTEEEKKELDADEGSRMRQQQQQPWFKYYQQQQQQPDPPEEIPPTPSEIASSVESSLLYDVKAPDPPSALQRDRSAASSSAVSSKSAATASSSAKKLQSPFAFMMSRSAEDILNVTAEELEIAHYMSDDHDERVDHREEKKNEEPEHLRTPKSSSTAVNVETTPALLPQPPHAASPGPSPLSSFPSLSQRLNKQRLAVANAMETIAASTAGTKGASPNRRLKQLPPIGRLATPPPPPPGQPTPPPPKQQVTTQPSGVPGSAPPLQQPPKPSTTIVPSAPSSTRSTRQDTAVASGSTASRAMTPIMRIRLGIEEPALEAPLAVPQAAANSDSSPSKERVVSPSGTLQTETTTRTDTDAQTTTSMEESEYYEQKRRWRKKKRMAEGIRRKLARSQGHRSDRSGTRYGRGGASSSRSAASSTLGRSVDDDESSFYSTADLSCQNILSRLIRTRCGNLDDSASLCENSESDEDEYYDESVASTMYSDHQKKDKSGRIVSFDDESDDRDARQQKILMLKQKKQMKETPQVNVSALEHPKRDSEEQKSQSVDENVHEGRSIVSDVASKQESKSSKHGNMSTEGRPSELHDDVALQLSMRTIQSLSESEATSRGRNGRRLHESSVTEEASVRSRGVQGESVEHSHMLDGEEHGFDDCGTSMSSRSTDERDSPQSHGNDSWLDVESNQSRESRGAFKQDWDVYGDADANGVEVDALETEGKADSNVVIRSILKSTHQGVGADLNDVDMHDRNFIKTFVTLASTSGIPLLYHCAARKLKSLPPPTRVTVRVRLGSESVAGDYAEPQVMWTSAEGRCLGSVDLFDIESLDRASTAELRSYPLALPSKSIVLRTEDGDRHIFEAMDEGVAYRFVHGMRWIVARLAFNLIIGNLNVSCELLNVERDEGVSPEALEKQVLMKAMNDVTNHLVNKSVQK